MKKTIIQLTSIFLAGVSLASENLHIPGKDGPGKGKHIVLVSGDEEYRSEQALPMLAKILSQHHGFDTTVVFAWDESGSYIDPNNQQGLKGLSALDSADLMIISTRFRQPSAEEAAHVTAYLNAGKPVIGLRTATHAFNGEGDFGGLPYGQFGRKILGEQWVSHHGKHKVEGARGVIEEANKDHAILNSVEDVFAPSDVYEVKHLEEADTILLRGAVTETLDPASKILDEDRNNPMMALAWLHPYTSPNGEKEGLSFATTAGASVDLVSEDLRRLVVNAAFFLNGLDVPEKANVDYADDYKPTFYGFINDKEFWKTQNLTAKDFELGKNPIIPAPPGTPEWDFVK